MTRIERVLRPCGAGLKDEKLIRTDAPAPR